MEKVKTIAVLTGDELCHGAERLVNFALVFEAPV